jgi:mannose-6-phosphate isomerase-like protein (cupin superfamily)
LIAILGNNRAEKGKILLQVLFNEYLITRRLANEMKYYASIEEVAEIQMEGVTTYKLLSENNGCVAGCCSGINIYHTTEYSLANAHSDQEGFLVLEGTGWAKIGDQEFEIRPQMSFIAPAGIKHCIKRSPDSQVLKVFWFHCAV